MTKQSLSSLKMQLKIHDAKEPMRKDYITVHGFEQAYIVWAKVNRKLFTKIREMEGGW